MMLAGGRGKTWPPWRADDVLARAEERTGAAMVSRRIELICGVLGGVLGLAALGVGLFVPSGLTCSSGTSGYPRGGCSHISVVQAQGLASLVPAIALFGGLSLCLLLFALWHVRSGSVAALVLLWVCTVALFGATVLALLSIGVLFVPADALALTASIAGTVAGRRMVAPQG